MALYVNNQVAQVYECKEVTNKKNGKIAFLAKIGIFSNKRVGDEWEHEEPLYLSARVKGNDAKAYLTALAPKSFATLTLKMYSYTQEIEGKKITKTAYEILKAEPFEVKKAASNNSDDDVDFSDDDIPF